MEKVLMMPNPPPCAFGRIYSHDEEGGKWQQSPPLVSLVRQSYQPILLSKYFLLQYQDVLLQ